MQLNSIEMFSSDGTIRVLIVGLGGVSRCVACELQMQFGLRRALDCLMFRWESFSINYVDDVLVAATLG